MSRLHSRRLVALIAGLSSIALVGACTAGGGYTYGGPPQANRTFKATSVTVNHSNDGCFLFCPYNDEPKVVNIGFRAIMGTPNSASGFVVSGANHWNGVFEQGPGEGQSYNYQGAEQAPATFNNLLMPDVADLLQGAHLEIAGVWAWKVEDDGILAANVNDIALAIVPAIVAALNQTIAIASVPSDTSQIVNAVLAAIGNLGFFQLFSTVFTGLLNNLNISSDDVVGSSMYVGIGSSGTLASIIEPVVGSIAFPTVAIPTLIVPPDIGGGKIFSLSYAHNFTDSTTNGGVDGQHTTTYNIS